MAVGFSECLKEHAETLFEVGIGVDQIVRRATCHTLSSLRNGASAAI
jgi:hypothetical protein